MLPHYLGSTTIYFMNNERHTQWLRGVLDLCVLSALTKGERYGYELSRQLLDSGLGQIKGGTLYPLLARLEKAGHVDTEWRQGIQGPGRKYYFLTEKGHMYLQNQSENWKVFANLIGTMLPEKGNNDEQGNLSV